MRTTVTSVTMVTLVRVTVTSASVTMVTVTMVTLDSKMNYAPDIENPVQIEEKTDYFHGYHIWFLHLDLYEGIINSMTIE